MTDELRSDHAALSAEQTIRMECLKIAMSPFVRGGCWIDVESIVDIASVLEKFVVYTPDSDRLPVSAKSEGTV